MTITNRKFKPFVEEFTRYILTEGKGRYYPSLALRAARVYDAYCKGRITTDEAMTALTALENDGWKGDDDDDAE